LETIQKHKNDYSVKSLTIEHIGGRCTCVFYGKLNNGYYFSYTNSDDTIVIFDAEPFSKNFFNNDDWETEHYIDDLDITEHLEFYNTFHKYIDIVLKENPFFRNKFHQDIKNLFLKKLEEKNMQNDENIDNFKDLTF